MAVEACVKPKLIADDSDDDEPLVFRRTKPNPLSSESKNSSTLRPDKQPGKPGSSAIRTLNDRSSSALKGKGVQSLKPSSSKPPIGGTQKSPPSASRSQKSPPSSTRPSPSPPPSRASPLKSPSVKPQKSPPSSARLTPPPPSRASSPQLPPVNGASSTNHQTKKGTIISVKEERCTPIKGEKHLRDEPEDSEDDMPLSSRLSVRSDNGNCNMVGEGKHSNGDSGDSDDDKPLSVRLSSGLAKGNSRLPERGSVAGEPSDTQNLKSVGVKSPNDSDDEKPLLSRLPAKSSAGTSSRKYDDSAEGKHLAHQNGYIKRENEIKKVPLNSAKRPSDASSGQSSIKKVKLSDASTSGKVKQIKEEQKDDDDHIPIAQRMNKASSGSKPMAVKKTLAKVDSSKLKRVDKKSKKIMKKSKYSKLSKELPNSGDGQKWTTLAHNGVIFPPPYMPHGVKMLYDGKPVDLTPEQEEVATMYAVMLETDYIKKEKFNENFFNDWKKLLGKNHVIQELKKCDFRPIYEWHLKEKEKKKQMSSEEKKALKEEKLKQEEKYMWAVVDGVKEKMGKLKKRIYPSDITINIGKDAPIPECPIPGQRWKEVRHDNTVTWLAYWNDPINPKEFKYVFLAASSTLKGQSDKEKYEKARKLKEYIQGIRAAYRRDFTSKDMTKRQIAVATYLIDRLALRAGNEKDDDEADTVGCCTLKVENVKPMPPNILEFDFLGKDSIKYYKQFEADPLVYKAVEQFRQGKSGSDDLFDKLDTSRLNAHLKELMPGLTAKVFRTFNASFTLDDMLAQGAGSGEVQEKIAIYQHANKEVAIICNHQRSVSKSHSAQMERLTARIDDAKAELNELETDLARAKKGKPPSKDSDGKRKRNLAPEAIEKKILSTKAKIEKYERDMQTKEDLKEIALGTSKINYLDPRITVAWCKRNEVPIEKVNPSSRCSASSPLTYTFYFALPCSRRRRETETKFAAELSLEILEL
ncbi:hypothetical protein Cgig2_008792 [Carnegiea gigantea]|uniref:DNA topoisomerase I n=1 Tax=Carnegiea gigantea TaxID=171969 RepID=A0A9Q1Q5J2_9CARY|nr:hypothetical protein Cgig2_008792 [Carnegiea gigantea]